MGQMILDGDPPLSIKLKRHQRARRLSLRVSRLDGVVTMTIPQWAREREAQAFAREKEDWIRRQLQAGHASIEPRVGGRVLFRGAEVPIMAGGGRSVRFHDGCIHVPGAPERLGVGLGAFMKTVARQQLAEASDGYASALGVSFQKITLRDTRSRWGSCTVDGRLMYSWRLVMAPPEILAYVAAHEVAHLREMNHGPEFWALVAQIYPDHKTARGWLRQNGARLHAYRFGN
jgi:hypothetical protein